MPSCELRSPARALAFTGAAPIGSNASRYCDARAPPLCRSRSASDQHGGGDGRAGERAAAAEHDRGRQRRRLGGAGTLACEAVQQALFDGRRERFLVARRR